MHTHSQAIKNAYDAFGRGDASVLMNLLTDDIQWCATGPGPVAGDYVGKEEVGRFFGKMGEIYGDTFRLEIIDILGTDRHVVVLTSEQGVHRGRSVEFRSAHVYTFENGRCTRFLSFQDDAFIQFWLTAQ